MSEHTSKIATQMRKGILEYIILAIIRRGDAYASDILDILKTNQLIVVEGTLYPMLSRLKTDGVISYFWIESPNGPPRKYYRLTDIGMELLQSMEHEWKALAKAVENITTKNT